MLLTDPFFLLYFFPVFILIYLSLSRNTLILNAFTLLANIFFYATFGIINLPILLIPLAIDYATGIYLYKKKKGLLRLLIFSAALISNLGILFYFKYSLLFFSSAHSLFPGIHFPVVIIATLLPVGISFITFQRISYLVDIYRRTTIPETNFLRYAVYDSLFPHIISGPILRYSPLKKQLSARTVTPALIFDGTKLFVIGFAFKILIANTLFKTEDALFGSLFSLNTFEVALLLLYFSLRIYFDFCGYSLMAMGIARLMGFDFPLNFNSPYQSQSITEFWRRWNITLSNWIRDYIYIPLGGNRRGIFRTTLNLLITMLLAGLWHGASWNFVLWGGVHGIFLVLERLSAHFRIRLPVHHKAKQIYTFLLVTCIWAFFKFTSLAQIAYIFKTLFAPSLSPFTWHAGKYILATLPVLLIAIILSFRGNEKSILALKPNWKTATLLIILFIATLLFSLFRQNVPFIYFQF